MADMEHGEEKDDEQDSRPWILAVGDPWVKAIEIIGLVVSLLAAIVWLLK